ncbi:MAG TPA: phenylalanine 4-monooxygenase, partial [Candidatus Gracilibacteria bacterium]|nr:phenylalanine 4-monooxygenase [Candidatus Gracilibacteria bacterium]
MKKFNIIIKVPVADISFLPLDHPGANDPEYRERRNQIARAAQEFRENPEHIPTIPYTKVEKLTWSTAIEKLFPLHEKFASELHRNAQKKLKIPEKSIPQLKKLNEQIERLHGFQLAPIEGLIDSRSFLSALGQRTMLCTQYIRHKSRPDYTPEPDIIHEVIGHVPAFADRDMVDFSVLLGKLAKKANEKELKAIERIYWFTIEFGLLEEEGKLKAFGAGLLSSIGEIQHCFTDAVERKP